MSSAPAGRHWRTSASSGESEVRRFGRRLRAPVRLDFHRFISLALLTRGSQVSSLSPELQQVFRQHADKALPVRKAAVLGAGIMGGGITITSAAHGVPVVMKDIAQAQLDLGPGGSEASAQPSAQKGKDHARAGGPDPRVY